MSCYINITFLSTEIEVAILVNLTWLRGSCDSDSKNWVGEVQGMWGVAELKKVLA